MEPVMHASLRTCLPLALLLLTACSQETVEQGAAPAPASASTAAPAPVAIAQGEEERKCTDEPRTDEHDERPRCEVSTGERNFCKKCGSALWLYDPTWPDLVHPFASAIDSKLPKPRERVHIMLKYKASWVEPNIRKGDKQFELYPEESIADWHKRTKMWVK